MNTLSIFSTKKSATLVCWVVLVMVLHGCSGIDHTHKREGEGRARIYSAPIETVWEAIPQATDSAGLKIIEQDSNQFFALAVRKNPGEGTDHEKVMISLHALDDSNTQVKVVTRTVWPSNVLADKWATVLFPRLDKLLPR